MSGDTSKLGKSGLVVKWVKAIQPWHTAQETDQSRQLKGGARLVLPLFFMLPCKNIFMKTNVHELDFHHKKRILLTVSGTHIFK